MKQERVALGLPESRLDTKMLLNPGLGGDASARRCDPDVRTGECLTIRLANTKGQRNAASMLLSRMYSWRGYGKNHSLGTSPNCVTFTAACQEEVVGTLTLTVDSRAGLAVDATFADKIAPFRAAHGAKLCELTKLAFDWTGSSNQHLAALFHLAFIYGSRQFACSDLFIEVNPRHRRFYERMLGFVRVGEVRMNASVNAPSQLLWLNVGAIRRMIDENAARPASNQRSLYRYFFSPDEEDGLYGRLTGAPCRGAVSDLEVLTACEARETSAKRLLGMLIGSRLRS